MSVEGKNKRSWWGMHRQNLRIGLIIFLSVLSLVGIPSASGQDWSTPLNVSDSSGNSRSPLLVAWGEGEVHTVWSDDTSGVYDVCYAHRLPDGSWSTPESVFHSPNASTARDLALDSSQTLHLVWTETDGIYYARLTPDGQWPTPAEISNGTGGSDPHLAVHSSGLPHVIWQFDQEIYHATQSGSGQWSDPSNVSRSQGIYSSHPRIVMDSNGTAHAVWSESDFDVYYAERSPGGIWSDPERISGVTAWSSRAPELTVDVDDNLHAVWYDGFGGGEDYRADVWYSTRPSGGTWGSPVEISDADQIAWFPHIAAASYGTVHVAWWDQSAGSSGIYYASRPSGGAWPRPHLVDFGNRYVRRLLVDGDGVVHLFWNDYAELFYATRSLGGTWSDTVVLDEFSRTAEMDLDGTGDVHVVWEASANGASDIFYSTSGGGPGLTYSISGHVRDGSGNPIPDVTVSAGAGGSATTDANGTYTISDLTAGTYTLTPSKSSYTFSPATRTVSVPPDQTGQDFTEALSADSIVIEARADIGMPYSVYRGCPSPYAGCGGPYHGFYYGVCTDLAMDAYDAGASFNLQDALYQDHLAHPGRYRHGSVRYPEDMRRYFHHNQQWLSHSQAYQPGDTAFFDWDGDGLCDHMDVISEIDVGGRPLRMVHAPGVCQVNPSGQAFEQDWNSHYDQHIQGHGRLSETGALTTSADETLQLLRITIDSPSVALCLRDANGKSTSDTYDENLVASGIEASIPYIPGGSYADLGTEQVITVTQPLSNTSQYFVKVTGEATVTYHLRIETLQDASVTDSEVFTQAIAAGESHGSAITLSAPGGTIEFSATSPAPAPLPGIPESLELAGLVGTSAQATFTITETGGQQALHNVALSATNLMDSLGGMMLGSMLSIDPTDFTVSAGDSQQVNAQVSLSDATPGVYRGGLVIRSDNGGVQMIPLSLDVQFHQVYLPTVLKSY